MHWYVDVIKKYAVWKGRARRKEYWMFTLITTIIAIVLAILEYATGSSIFRYVADAYALLVLLPNIAVQVRRLHDTNRTGWWCWLILTGIGGIWLLVLSAMEGNPGENKYGPDPKAVTA